MRKTPFISVVLAAKPPEQRKKIVTSVLPQAKNARCGVSTSAHRVGRVIEQAAQSAAGPR
jgi:hypothetical protein